MLNKAFECHSHIALTGSDYKKIKEEHSMQINKSIIKANLSKYQAGNISFLRDAGDKWGCSAYAKTIAADYGIDYRTPIYALHKEGYYGSILGKSFDSTKDFEKHVQYIASQNGDFIKIMLSGIMDFNCYGRLSAYEISAVQTNEIIKISHDYGFKVMAHVNGSDNIKKAIDAGVDSIEHGFFMDSSCINMLKSSNIVWVPTFAPVYNLLSDKNFNKEIISKIIAGHTDSLLNALENELSIGIGCDAGSYSVLHGLGTATEYDIISRIINNNPAYIKAINKGNETIKSSFKRL